MSLLLICIGVAVWLVLLVLVWAVCAAAGRGDRFGELDAWADDAPAPARATAPAPQRAPPRATSSPARVLAGSGNLAIDTAQLSGQLQALAELVAHRDATRPRLSDEELVLLAGVADLVTSRGALGTAHRGRRFVRNLPQPNRF